MFKGCLSDTVTIDPVPVKLVLRQESFAILTSLLSNQHSNCETYAIVLHWPKLWKFYHFASWFCSSDRSKLRYLLSPTGICLQWDSRFEILHFYLPPFEQSLPPFEQVICTKEIFLNNQQSTRFKSSRSDWHIWVYLKGSQLLAKQTHWIKALDWCD